MAANSNTTVTDEDTEAIRDAIEGIGIKVVRGGERTNEYPHVWVLHAGWKDDAFGMRQRWHLVFNYSPYGDPTDLAAITEAAVLNRLLYTPEPGTGQPLAQRDGDGTDLREGGYRTGESDKAVYRLFTRIPIVSLNGADRGD